MGRLSSHPGADDDGALQLGGSWHQAAQGHCVAGTASLQAAHASSKHQLAESRCRLRQLMAAGKPHAGSNEQHPASAARAAFVHRAGAIQLAGYLVSDTSIPARQCKRRRIQYLGCWQWRMSRPSCGCTSSAPRSVSWLSLCWALLQVSSRERQLCICCTWYQKHAGAQHHHKLSRCLCVCRLQEETLSRGPRSAAASRVPAMLAVSGVLLLPHHLTAACSCLHCSRAHNQAGLSVHGLTCHTIASSWETRHIVQAIPELDTAALDASPGTTAAQSPPGPPTSATGSDEIVTLALAPSARLLAMGCTNGELSILDLSQVLHALPAGMHMPHLCTACRQAWAWLATSSCDTDVCAGPSMSRLTQSCGLEAFAAAASCPCEAVGVRGSPAAAVLRPCGAGAAQTTCACGIRQVCRGLEGCRLAGSGAAWQPHTSLQCMPGGLTLSQVSGAIDIDCAATQPAVHPLLMQLLCCAACCCWRAHPTARRPCCSPRPGSLWH